MTADGLAESTDAAIGTGPERLMSRYGRSRRS
jgi:hypothetical protein